jgi:hypothetical protein
VKLLFIEKLQPQIKFPAPPDASKTGQRRGDQSTEKAKFGG